jgi:hypothetical protein
MDHPPYSPDLTSTVPSTEVILKGRRLPCWYHEFDVAYWIWCCLLNLMLLSCRAAG